MERTPKKKWTATWENNPLPSVLRISQCAGSCEFKYHMESRLFDPFPRITHILVAVSRFLCYRTFCTADEACPRLMLMPFTPIIRTHIVGAICRRFGANLFIQSLCRWLDVNFVDTILNYGMALWLIDFEPRLEKTNVCRCENKDADQLRGNRKADQRLCFRYLDSTIPLQFPASSHLQWLYSLVCVRPGQNPNCWFSHSGALLGIK